jgi:hypothetical protein
LRRTFSLPPLPPTDPRFTPAAASFGRAGQITPGLRRMLPVQIAPATRLTDCSVSPRLPAPPSANFRLAPDVILRLPVAQASGLRRPLCTPARLLCCVQLALSAASSPGLAVNPRPSPKTDLQLARNSTLGLRRLCCALGIACVVATGLRRLPGSPAKLATSPRASTGNCVLRLAPTTANLQHPSGSESSG